jgi:septum formation protein
MLIDKIPLLQTANIILASGSPRRKEILNDLLKLKVNIVPSTFEENLDKSQFTPEAYVKENARLKALEVWNRLASSGVR